MTFIVYLKDGGKTTYSNRYNENIEHEYDAGWEDVYETFLNAEYIELF